MDENQADREIANAEAQINLLNHRIRSEETILERLKATEERKYETKREQTELLTRLFAKAEEVSSPDPHAVTQYFEAQTTLLVEMEEVHESIKNYGNTLVVCLQRIAKYTEEQKVQFYRKIRALQAEAEEPEADAQLENDLAPTDNI